MNPVRIKICGLTRAQDVSQAVDCGADYIGLVFAASPRQVDVKSARELLKPASGRASTVALFMDQATSEIAGVLAAVDFDLLQFHGQESNAFCRQFGRPFLKAVPMASAVEAKAAFDAFPDADGLLLDSHEAGSAGGSGRVFDWSEVPRSRHRIWLAGGLNPGNVATAIARVGPWAVDVSSGVERRPGIKDHGRIKTFIDAARAARPG